ncbi:MAG TPA: HepT-like ribonuclease domain-containing protein [Candidatus Bathyarchaeia archaeon]|nr:HepT-like ribonuclease domain-containing protein [Candidatus Bathyarchaeia archaeon]
MMKGDTVYLRHILDAISRIEEYTEGVDDEDFMDDNLVQAGVMREIEIIGEATKRLSQEFREKYPDIP